MAVCGTMFVRRSAALRPRVHHPSGAGVVRRGGARHRQLALVTRQPDRNSGRISCGAHGNHPPGSDVAGFGGYVGPFGVDAGRHSLRDAGAAAHPTVDVGRGLGARHRLVQPRFAGAGHLEGVLAPLLRFRGRSGNLQRGRHADESDPGGAGIHGWRCRDQLGRAHRGGYLRCRGRRGPPRPHQVVPRHSQGLLQLCHRLVRHLRAIPAAQPD
mmetsp:Transcript_26945/g.70809  ORF Transcript_26945/g.70809 Transcript_26945/m.70809 type:complete len:213 (-) Transcript_26945:497-1135(-)